MKKILLLIVSAAAVLSAAATTRYVDYKNGADGGDGTSSPWKTLVYAVANASANDEIVLKKGTHPLTAAITVDKTLTIRGEGENWETTVDGAYENRTFAVTVDGVLVCGLTFYRLGSTAGSYNGLFQLKAVSTVSNVVFTACGKSTDIGYPPLYANKGLITCCYLTNNVCAYAAGVCIEGAVTMENTVLVGNTVTKNGGVRSAIVRNYARSAKIRNCTIANNTLYGDAALYTRNWDPSIGFYSCRISNTIIYGNLDASKSPAVENNWYAEGTQTNWFNNCTTPQTLSNGASLSTASGNIFVDPKLTQDGMHLGADSPCKNAGSSEYGTAVDIAGKPRGTPPAIGAFEYVEIQALDIALSASDNHRVRQPDRIQLFCATSGSYTEPLTYAWSFNGASETVDSTDANPYITAVGVYSNPKVTVRDAGGQSCTKSLNGTFVVHMNGKVTFYVDYAGGSDSNDGSQAFPWKTVSAAVAKDEVFDGDEIVLVKGTHVVSQRISIGKAIRLHGGGTREETVLDGNHVPVSDAVSIRSGAILSDITITGFDHVNQGRVLAMGGNATVSNVVVTGCGNAEATADTAIGTSSGLLTGCVITNNYSGWNCGVHVTGPTTVENCLIANNVSVRATQQYHDYKCVVYIYYGEGGNPVLRNCTIANNRLLNGDGYGIVCDWAMTAVNNIVWGNVSVSSGTTNDWVVLNDRTTANWRFNCLRNASALSGAGNFEADPLFAADGFRLCGQSPCRDAGDDALGATTVDVLGKPRVVGKHIDVGCAECQSGMGMMLIVR